MEKNLTVRRFVVAGLAVALAGTGVVTLWRDSDPVAAAQAPIATAVDQGSALLAAHKQGAPVEVTSLKTESAQFFANPGGTMTMQQSIVPLRIKRNGGWTDIDPTLVRRTDGSFTPKAVEPDVVLSAGGTQPFARMTAGGAEFALSWPRPLPAPAVSGDTATYSEVMPGVDLRARVGRDGFGHELVVKTREAAADPALAKVSFGMTAKGVTVSADERGALKAVNANGETVFSAPVASMWDSAERKAAVGVAVSSTELVLSPDRALLADPAARLPITIDPQYSYHTVRQNGWTLVRSGWADSSHWNMGPEDDDARSKGVARVGVSPDSGNGSVDRSLFRFDTAPLAGTVINSASFHIKQGWKYTHTCVGDQTPWLDLHVTGDIGPGTTWNTQPGWSSGNRIGSARPVFKLGQSCGPNWVDFPIKDTAQQAANNGWANLNLGLKDRDESGVGGWKRFYVQNEPNGVESYPHIKVEYNHYPGNATDHATDPVLTSCKHCGGKAYVAGDRILLKGRISDADGGSLLGGILVYGPGLPATGKWLDAGYLNSGSVFSAELDLSGFKDGDTYTWEMWAWDGALDSRRKTAGPPFTIDRSEPASPAVDSVLYQPDNDWHGGPGVAGKFWFKANGADDVDHYKYGWTSPPHIPVPLDDGNTLGGHASVFLTPLRAEASQVLFVSSVDRAGNESDPTEYRFNVRSELGPKALWPLDGHSRDDAQHGERDATLQGGATWTEAGAVGSAAQLDGVNGHLTAPHTVLTGASFSVSAWVKLDPRHPGFNATAVSQLSSQLGSALPGFQLSWLDNNTWGFGIAKSATDIANDYAFSAVGAPQPGSWTHLTGVYDESVNSVRLYVNGSLAGSAQRSAANWNSYGEVRIGDAGAVGQRWQGAIDEVRVYDRALVGNEVRALVGLGNVQAGQWKFDDRSGTTAGNNIPGGTPMTLRSGARFASGAVGGGLQLDGVDDSAQTGESVLRTEQSFAVTAWVKQDKDVPDGFAFAALSQDGPSKSGFYLDYRQVDGVGRWELQAPADDSTPDVPGALVRSTMTAKTRTWTHLAGVFDRPAGQIKLYVNGVHAGTAPWKSYNKSSGSLVVGRAKWDGNPAAYWPGGVDDVRAYSRVLDEAEIRGILAADNVATGSWKLDGNAADDSGSSRTGTVRGNPAWVPGQTTTANADDLAAGLDGVDDRISAPSAVDPAQSYAVSAWVKPEAANVAQTVVSQDGTSSTGTQERSAFALQATADGKWSITGTLGNRTPVSAAGGRVQAGVWTHLAAVHDVERKELSLYINGVIADTKPFEGAWADTGELQIGCGQAGGRAVEFFRGAIDDVRTYQRTLFEDEIRVIAGRDLALAHNLRLDNNPGDEVGAREGTLYGGATFAPGRSGQAIQLDGVDDAVQTDGIDLRTDENFTVSTWVNLRRTSDGEVTAISLDSGQGRKFRLGHIKDGLDNAHGAWVFEMPEQNGSITAAALSVQATEIGDDKWTHLTGVYNAKAKMIQLYVNGIRVGNGTLSTPWAGGEKLQIGRSRHNNAYSRHWLGRIDDMRIYTGALSGDRVHELYKSYGA